MIDIEQAGIASRREGAQPALSFNRSEDFEHAAREASAKLSHLGQTLKLPV
jgi:hypothetical protein